MPGPAGQSPQQRPDTDDALGQRGLAAAAWANQTQGVPRLELKPHIAQQDCPASGCNHRRAFQIERFTGRRQIDHPRVFIRGGEGFFQPAKASSCRDDVFPVADGHVDRCQRTRGRHRTGDDRTGGQFALDHQVGAKSQKCRLQHHPKDLGQTAERTADIAGAGLQIQMLGICRLKPRDRATAKPHCTQDVGISGVRIRQIVSIRRGAVHLSARTFCQKFGDYGENDQNQRARNREHAQKGMQQIDKAQKKRHPRQVKQGDWRRAGDK